MEGQRKEIMARERILHTIKMVSKEDGTEAIYKDVKTANYHYGCLVELKLADGNTATFETEKWELWDLTPQKGWNCNIPIFHTEGDKSDDRK